MSVILVMSTIFGQTYRTGLEVDQFRRAVAALQRDDFRFATSQFGAMAESNSSIAPLARFALGNGMVQQASFPGVSPKRREELLLAAIRAYRSAQARQLPKELSDDDIRHNLLVAKRMLAFTPPSRGASDPSRAATAKADDNTAEPRVLDPSRAKPSNSAPNAPSSKSEDKGEVYQPTKGIKVFDPGPLSPENGKSRLDLALERIERQRRAAPVTTRPIVPNDH